MTPMLAIELRLLLTLGVALSILVTLENIHKNITMIAVIGVATFAALLLDIVAIIWTVPL